jgi:hypothetical protein
MSSNVLSISSQQDAADSGVTGRIAIEGDVKIPFTIGVPFTMAPEPSSFEDASLRFSLFWLAVASLIKVCLAVRVFALFKDDASRITFSCDVSLVVKGDVGAFARSDGLGTDSSSSSLEDNNRSILHLPQLKIQKAKKN